MSILFGKNILIIIPKSQFCEQELYGVKNILQQNGAHVVVLSQSGQEARGMNKDIFQPDGMIIDWNKQPGVQEKYHAVVLVGPQILTDHYRFGSVIGAMGSALVVLVKASLATGEIPLPQDETTRKELENINAVCVGVPVINVGKLVLGQGAGSVDQFSQTILDLLETKEDR